MSKIALLDRLEALVRIERSRQQDRQPADGCGLPHAKVEKINWQQELRSHRKNEDREKCQYAKGELFHARIYLELKIDELLLVELSEHENCDNDGIVHTPPEPDRTLG